MNKKNMMVIGATVWVVLLVICITTAVTMSLMGVSADGRNAALLEGATSTVRVDREAYEMVQRYQRLEEVRKILKDGYYQELSDDDLVLGAVRGMMGAAGDAYTFYYTPEEMRGMAEHTEGAYEGVGLLLSPDKDGYLTILRVFEDTPAMVSGMKPGDRIIQVDGTPVSAATEKQMNEAMALIKQGMNSKVKISVLRGEEMIDFNLTKAAVNVSRTSHHMIGDDIGYVVIYEFMGNDVSGFEKAVKDLKEQGMKALVIDVRNNPGGLLPDVVDIADMLLPKGLIVYTEDRAGKREEFFSDEAELGLPMAVLTNGMSASASEILAGSLQDYGVASVVGETTFGKGIVQTVIPFRSDGAGLQLTTARYFTPKGRSIHGTGITPDVEVALGEGTDVTDMELNPERDVQLMKAVELLREKLSIAS